MARAEEGGGGGKPGLFPPGRGDGWRKARRFPVVGEKRGEPW
jgi:hypothetical protein